jgi:hypothetical protein
MTWIKANPLAGKRIGIIGSSSADTDYTPSNKNYWQLIAERTGAIILDYADAGSTLTASTSNYSAETTNQLKRIDELPIDLDIVVLQPAVNDDSNNRPIGTFDSRNVTDVYGALHTMCFKLYDKFPITPIGIMTGQYYGSRDAQTSVYQTAVKEVCGYYGIPVCDLKTEGRTPYNYWRWWATYAPDQTHLNELGDLVISRRVEAFTRSLLGY